MLGIAGVTKLADRAGAREAVVGFGLPSALAGVGALALPVAELSAGVLVLVRQTARAGALVALLLMVTFMVAIALNLLRGRTPDCHCFGQLHSAPAGPATLARNAVLAGVAAFVAASSRPDLFGWTRGFSGAQWLMVGGWLLTLAVAVASGLLALALLKQHGRMLLRLDALESRTGAGGTMPPSPGPAPIPATAAAPFSVSDARGAIVTLEQLQAGGRPLLLLFTDPGCGPCNALMPEVGRWQADLDGSLRVVTISRGDSRAAIGKAAEHHLADALIEPGGEVSRLYGVQGTPSAVLVGADGNVRFPVAAGVDAIRQLVTSAQQPVVPVPVSSGGARAAGHAVGSPAPDFSLPDLDGERRGLGDFRGRRVLLLFWDPGCGFCVAMLEQLRALERERLGDAPEILLISTGDEAANRSLQVASVVLRDDSSSVAPRYEANGTPMAVLIDEQGRIAAPLAVGGPAVLTLARGEAQAAAVQMAQQDGGGDGGGKGSGAGLAALPLGAEAPPLALRPARQAPSR